jgi:hypothetical protein|tara:strand:+ start:1688 stop:1948 length:261 start_codon:yes stop_codon:yes gene_type:complete
LDKNNLIKERERAHQAQILMSNPLFIETKEMITNNLLEAWQTTSMNQSEEREKIYQMLVASRSVFSHIESVLTTGKMAQMELDKTR